MVKYIWSWLRVFLFFILFGMFVTPLHAIEPFECNGTPYTIKDNNLMQSVKYNSDDTIDIIITPPT